MQERPELRTNDNPPIPILRRAPLLLDGHGESMRAIKDTLAFAGDIPPRQAGARDSGTSDGNIRRSISHRISRVATTTLGRSLSGSLRRSRNASQSRVEGGEVWHRSDVRIRKVHDSTLPTVSASRPATDARVSGLEGTIALASANDGPSHSTHAHDSAMQTELVDQQHAKSSVAEVPVPALLQQGVPMTKVSAKSQKSYIFKLDADQGQIIWESKRLRISTCIVVG
jgi:phosphatidylinositol phospholipase C delta